MKQSDEIFDSNLVVMQKFFDVEDMRESFLGSQAEMIPPEAPKELLDLKNSD